MRRGLRKICWGRPTPFVLQYFVVTFEMLHVLFVHMLPYLLKLDGYKLTSSISK